MASLTLMESSTWLCQVDNGVIEHLLPSLHKDDWDVLIAHFLGVDHAGHIFGVDSTPMIQKLKQYNQILEVGFLMHITFFFACYFCFISRGCFELPYLCSSHSFF